ncbi:MAG: hypothetical protein IKY53_07630 [Lachnospiraceae bacterium]|nr:hypothetical protein [Lachnospiraceae bacterium]
MSGLYKKKYFVVVLLVACVVFLGGCGGLSQTEKNQGRENAIQYIENKYGFKPTVKSVKEQTYNGSPILGGSASGTGYFYVKMEHEKKSFYVFISGLSVNTDGIDNYQVEVIEDAIRQEVLAMLPNVINIDYCIGNKKVTPDDAYYGMISLKYDGSNLSEVLEDAQLKRIIVSLADSDLSCLTEELVKETFGSDTDILFVNYKSVEAYAEVGYPTYGLLEYGLSSGIEEKEEYIIDYVKF